MCRGTCRHPAPHPKEFLAAVLWGYVNPEDLDHVRTQFRPHELPGDELLITQFEAQCIDGGAFVRANRRHDADPRELALRSRRRTHASPTTRRYLETSLGRSALSKGMPHR
jgi:hypothetical protein